MTAIAEYEGAADKKMTTYIHSGKGEYTTPMRFPATIPATAKAEQAAKWPRHGPNS